MNFRNYIACLGLCLALVSGAGTTEAQTLLHRFYNQRHVASRHSLPKHHYGQNQQTFRDRGLAYADPVVEVQQAAEFLRTKTVECRGCSQEFDVPANVIPDAARTALKRTTRRKPFHFSTLLLSAEYVTLSQVGLDLLETGHITATGRIEHSGGVNGETAGSNVTLFVRAYASRVPGASETVPINSPMVWQSRCEHWVGRDHPEVIPLTSAASCYSESLRRRFDEITHLEVELVVERDR